MNKQGVHATEIDQMVIRSELAKVEIWYADPKFYHPPLRGTPSTNERTNGRTRPRAVVHATKTEMVIMNKEAMGKD